jgi:hypothetical protein
MMQIGCWQCMAKCPREGVIVGTLWYLWHRVVCPVKGDEAEVWAEEMRHAQ